MQCPRIILSSVACPALQYFSTLSCNGHDFRWGEVTERKRCVLISCTTFAWNISNCKRNRARMIKKMYIGLHVNYRIFLSDFNETLIFSAFFGQMLKYEILWKSVQWEPSFSMRTGHDETNSGFSRLETNGNKHCWPRHQEQQEITGQSNTVGKS
jgi:hypothetical protein